MTEPKLLAAGSSRPWLTNAEGKLKRIFKLGGEFTHSIVPDSMKVLWDWSDHSIVSFRWQFKRLLGVPGRRYYDEAQKNIGFAAVYQNQAYVLDSDEAFVGYWSRSRISLSPSSLTHLATALECSVLGWTEQKKRMDSVDQMRAFGLDLDIYKGFLRYVRPPHLQETSKGLRLVICVYHWAIGGMMVQWGATESKDGQELSVKRVRQVIGSYDL